ncbi:GGDEF domain-containing protein [Sphingosinicella sp. BN140058]|uniref:GGDEF domain-containing protein n=1 Tax=Sphingosinicella sp. BN140058 TaxID=1892855 RepID=UPI00101385BB|nr:GGDEF domain-containing protein [Sphingosinicella sp. BN140058]QAY75597.1 GGDEF domain-containing protein [Sphingosinicella sp. BN140058]
MANAPLEWGFALLLGTTLIALIAGDTLLDRSFTINRMNAGDYILNGYGDQAEKGSSTVSTDNDRPLHWRCALKDGFQYPYCGYQLLFGGWGGVRGMNFAKVESISIDMSYSGPGETIRFNLLDFDPRYSHKDRPDTFKPNKVEVFVRTGDRRVIEVRPEDFSVAEWWLTRFSMPPALSRPQFENIVSLDIQTGSWSAKGEHAFDVHSITFNRKLLSRAELYLVILAAWVIFAIAFLAMRLVRLAGDLKRRKRTEQAALAAARAAQESALTDALTSVLNRRGLVRGYEGLTAGVAPSSAISVILIDIDFFKRLNDSFGHNAGDAVLVAFSSILSAQASEADLVGRWGGEEFLIVHVGGRDDAMALAERVRGALHAYDFGACGTVTASFGIHTAPVEGADLDQMVGHADEALYTAKSRGRNRADFYTGVPQLVA